jgi:hypothetical protein
MCRIGMTESDHRERPWVVGSSCMSTMGRVLVLTLCRCVLKCNARISVTRSRICYIIQVLLAVDANLLLRI